MWNLFNSAFAFQVRAREQRSSESCCTDRSCVYRRTLLTQTAKFPYRVRIRRRLSCREEGTCSSR